MCKLHGLLFVSWFLKGSEETLIFLLTLNLNLILSVCPVCVKLVKDRTNGFEQKQASTCLTATLAAPVKELVRHIAALMFFIVIFTVRYRSLSYSLPFTSNTFL